LLLIRRFFVLKFFQGGDWDWFGGRMIQALILNGYSDLAMTALDPMLTRVIANGDFNEWYDQQNRPMGSWKFHGSAGVLGKAIKMLQQRGLISI
jgi:hypothetical protein